MNLFISLLWLLLILIREGILATIFFMCVRAVMLAKEISWLKTVDKYGRVIANVITGLIDRFWFKIAKHHVAEETGLLIGVAILLEVFLIIVVLTNSIK